VIRDDVLVWISTVWFVVMCGMAIWYFLNPMRVQQEPPFLVIRLEPFRQARRIGGSKFAFRPGDTGTRFLTRIA
jgi:hypothetical protein